MCQGAQHSGCLSLRERPQEHAGVSVRTVAKRLHLRVCIFRVSLYELPVGVLCSRPCLCLQVSTCLDARRLCHRGDVRRGVRVCPCVCAYMWTGVGICESAWACFCRNESVSVGLGTCVGVQVGWWVCVPGVHVAAQEAQVRTQEGPPGPQAVPTPHLHIHV